MQLGILEKTKIRTLKYSKNFLNLDHSKSLTLDTIKDLILMKELEFKFQGLRQIDNYNYLKKPNKNIKINNFPSKKI